MVVFVPLGMGPRGWSVYRAIKTLSFRGRVFAYRGINDAQSRNGVGRFQGCGVYDLLRRRCALLLIFDAKSRAFGHLCLWKLMRGSRLLAAQMNSRMLPRWVSLVWMTSVLREAKIQKTFMS